MREQKLPAARIFVCAYEKAPGKSQCLVGEGEKCVQWMRQAIKDRGLKGKIAITRSRCQDYCDGDGCSITLAPTIDGHIRQFSGVRLGEVQTAFEQWLKELDLSAGP